MKYIQRLGTQKSNFQVQVKMIQLICDTKEPSTFSVQWKRGPSKEETEKFDVQPSVGSAQINQMFVRYSQIYREAQKGGKYLKKTCQFKLRKWENGVARQIAEVEVDMAPFITKTDGKHKIHFSKSELPNTYLDIEFKLTESDHVGGDDSGDEEEKQPQQTHLNGAGSGDSKRYEDEIYQLQQELQKIRIESQEHLFQKQNLDEQLQLKEGVIQSLTQDKEQAMRSLHQMSNTNQDEQQVAISTLTSEKDILQQQINQLREQLLAQEQQNKQQKQQYEDQIQQLEARISSSENDTQQQIEALEYRLSESQEHNLSLTSAYESLQTDLYQSEQREKEAIARLSGDSQVIQQQMDQEREATRQRFEDEKQEMQSVFEQDKQNIRDQHADELHAARERFETEKYNLRQELEQEKHELTSTFEQHKTTLTNTYEEQLNEIRNQLETANSSQGDAYQQIEQENQNLRAQAEASQARINELERQVYELQASIEEQNAGKAQIEEELRQTREDSERITLRLQDLEALAQLKENSILELESKLHHTTDNVHDLEKKLHKAQSDHSSEVKNLNHKIKELEERASAGGGHDDDFDRYAF
eukprot:403338218